jgi:hypothetical protein
MYKIYKSIIQDGIPEPIQVRTGENKDESHGIPVVTKLISVASRADMVMEDDKEEERTETYRPHPSLKEEPCEWESVCTRKTEKADVGVAAEVEGEELLMTTAWSWGGSWLIFSAMIPSIVLVWNGITLLYDKVRICVAFFSLSLF